MGAADQGDGVDSGQRRGGCRGAGRRGGLRMFQRRRSAEDFAEEINAHLELEADELKREGATDEEARRRARIEFGNVLAARERFYMRGRLEWLDNLARDMRFAVRQLGKNPSFAVTAIVVLALGMG